MVSSVSGGKDGCEPFRVGKYKIGEVIGKGFFAEVRRAEHIGTGKIFAVKIFDLANRPAEELLTIAKNEVFVLRILRHENIVKVYEHIRENNHSYMFMDLASGQDLVELIRSPQPTLTDRSLRTCYKKIVETVIYLHSRGIYHGDLKPENVIVDPNTNAVILVDFGASQRRGSEVQPRSSIRTGTPHYLPPECITDKDWELGKVDVWSLGVLLYVALVGAHPFQGSNQNEVFASVVRDEVYYPKELGHSVTDLIQRMLNKDVSDRIGLQDVMEHPWMVEENLVRDVPIPLSVTMKRLYRRESSDIRTDTDAKDVKEMKLVGVRPSLSLTQATTVPTSSAVSKSNSTTATTAALTTTTTSTTTLKRERAKRALPRVLTTGTEPSSFTTRGLSRNAKSATKPLLRKKSDGACGSHAIPSTVSIKNPGLVKCISLSYQQVDKYFM